MRTHKYRLKCKRCGFNEFHPLISFWIRTGENWKYIETTEWHRYLLYYNGFRETNQIRMENTFESIDSTMQQQT